MATRARRGLVCCALVVCNFWLSTTGNADEIGSPGSGVTITVGYSKTALPRGVFRDAQAGVSAWAERLGRREGKAKYATTLLLDFEDCDRVVRQVNEHQIDVLAIAASDYLALRERMRLDPYNMVVIDDGPMLQFVLLAPRGASPPSLESLQGKSLIIESRDVGKPQLLWLDTLLLRKGLPESERFFGSTTVAHNASRAILPVFFEQKGACVARRCSFDTMVELNPQVGKQLMVVVESPSLLGGLGCFTPHCSESLKKEVKDFFLGTQPDPIRDQFLLLFQVKAQVAFEPQCLETWEALLEERARLKARNGP